MNGWGRFAFLVTLGVSLGAGCGGRTGVPYDDTEDPDGGTSSGNGGLRTTGGRPSTGGTATGGAAMGGRPGVAGDSFGGVAGVTTGGVFGTAGAFPVGGFAGFPVGGFGGGFGGAFPVGGVGGVGGASGDCQSCLFQTCSGQLVQCFQNFGCLSILGCIQVTGCNTLECYSPDTCGGVIDQWGGPNGESMSLVLEGVACALGSGCPCN